jgi:hypothetical protein
MSIQQSEAENVSMLPFVGFFLIAVVALQAIVIAITTIFQFDAGGAMGIIVMFVATQWPMSMFVNKSSRVPTKGERVRFATLGTIGALLLSLAIVYIIGFFVGDNLISALIADAQAEGMSAPLVVGFVLLVGFVIGWLVVYFASGFSAKQAMKIFDKQAGR